MKVDLQGVKAAEIKDTNNKELVFDVPAGPYIMQIKAAEDTVSKSSGNPQLVITLDVAEGIYKDFAENAEVATGNAWSYKTLYIPYGTKAQKERFKRFLDKLEESNRNFRVERWAKNQDEQDFVGLLVGVVLDENLNIYKGKVYKKIQPNIHKIYSVDEIDAGKHAEPRYLSDGEKDELDRYNTEKLASTCYAPQESNNNSDTYVPF